MTIEEKINLIKETIDTEEELSETTILADLDEYNSYVRLSIMVMLDDEFGVSISGEQAKGFVTVADILDCMKG